jgi:hypothetical protein
VLDFATLSGGTGNDLPYPLILPAYTAAAFYHKKLPADLQSDLGKALAESRAFAAEKSHCEPVPLHRLAVPPDRGQSMAH